MSSQPELVGQRSPWAWVPSLYLAQGIPYVMVMTVSVIMYKRLGISNTDIALYTSWLYLPWVIKPLWSPMVDLLGTKRRWIVWMQAVVGVLLAGVALTIPADRFFQYTIGLFWLMAFASATHDIAADGFYMLGLAQHQQAAFVGIRSTFYRIATIAAQGLLVMLAGYIETSTGLPPAKLAIQAGPEGAVVATASAPAHALAAGPISLAFDRPDLWISTTPSDPAQVKAALKQAQAENVANGFAPESEEAAKEGPSWWKRHISTPSAEFLRTRFGDPRLAEGQGGGNIAIAGLRLTASPKPGEAIIVLLTREEGEERIEIAEGGRLTFTEHNWNKPAQVAFKVNPKLRGAAAATFKATSGNIPLAWTSVTFVVAGMFGLFFLYHFFALPRPAADHASRSGTAGGFVGEFLRTFVLFFRKKDIVVVMAFLLLYRFAEAQLVKLVSPFLLDPREVGGLGLSTGQVGLAYGTIGIGALMVGGLLGGYLVSRRGLRFWLWPMVFIMHLPDLAFVYLAYTQPESLTLISAAVAAEQFGYGFGFTAYMLFMIMVADGEHKTAHYAICTGFMALGMMLPGMFSGWLQEIVGYQHFFLWVLISTIPGFLVAALVKIDPAFARKKA